jgi:N utilization substance protein B
MGKRDARKETRECFMQLLYEMDIQKDFAVSRKDLFWSRLEGLRKYGDDVITVVEKKGPSPEKKYFDSMYYTTTEHLEEIDRILTGASDNWKLERISRVELAILRLAVAELIYVAEIPDSVSINEAVELAKKFGSEDSGKFVNGILGNVVRGRDETTM